MISAIVPAVALPHVVIALQNLVLDSPNHSFELTGIPAAIVILGTLGLVAAFIIRFFRLRSHAKDATKARGAAEAELRALFAAMHDVVFVVDREGRYVRVPVTSANALYRLRPELAGRNVADVLPEAPARAIRSVAGRVIDSQQTEQAEFSIDFDGQPVWFAATASPFDATSVLWVARDITETKSARDALAQSESRYRLLFDRNPCAMWVYDYDTRRIIEANDAAVLQYGYSREEFPRMKLDDLMVPDATGALPAFLSAIGSDEATVNVVKHRKADGGIMDVEVRGHPLGVPRRHLRLVVSTDITERKLLEEQLRQSQKMEAIGTLAGGVAHDFNNILTVIASYSSMLLTDDRYPDIRSDLEEISTAARRATGLTRQLLTFSRKAIVQLQPIDINTVIDDMGPMLRRLLMEHIDLDFNLSDGLNFVTADLSQIEQILLNLTVNAADAMPDGGTLVIETHNIWLDETYAEMHSGVVPGQYVLLAVTDSGIGMDAETVRKIFEPFFTTKEIGRGTGLGLATVYAIVKQLGGHIWVYSEPGHGAAFKIYLPREGASEVREPAPAQIGPLTATGTILLVEDDVAVRRAARRMLEKTGFTVIEAQDGEHGLAVASDYEGNIDVIVTDLMMPNMNGGDFAQAIALTRPGSRVVFTSGYTDDSVLRRRLVSNSHAFVQKPFTGDQLVRTITSLLDGDSQQVR